VAELRELVVEDLEDARGEGEPESGSPPVDQTQPAERPTAEEGT
jgi:hypothetical protein